MEYSFTYHLRREGIIFAEPEGAALIERSPTTGWCIKAIVLHGWYPSAQGPVRNATVALRGNDPLSEEICLWLYEHKRAEINWEWGQYIKRARAEREEVY